MQFRFESIVPVLVLSLILVGMPAVILKQTAVWFVRAGQDGPRLRLLGASIGAGAAIGTATIVLHASLSGRLEFKAYPLFTAIPAVELGVAAALLASIGAADGWLWWRFTAIHGAQSRRSAAIWLVGGNVWIPWALLLMHFWRQSNGFLD